MSNLSHEERIKHSNLMRAFCHDVINEREIQPWETIIWINKWPELSEFLSEESSEYGKKEQDYFKIMEQFIEVQMSFKWMIKAHYEYMKLYASKFGLEPPPSMAATFLPKIIILVIVIGAIVYFVAN